MDLERETVSPGCTGFIQAKPHRIGAHNTKSATRTQTRTHTHPPCTSISIQSVCGRHHRVAKFEDLVGWTLKASVGLGLASVGKGRPQCEDQLAPGQGGRSWQVLLKSSKWLRLTGAEGFI